MTKETIKSEFIETAEAFIFACIHGLPQYCRGPELTEGLQQARRQAMAVVATIEPNSNVELMRSLQVATTALRHEPTGAKVIIETVTRKLGERAGIYGDDPNGTAWGDDLMEMEDVPHGRKTNGSAQN